MLKSITKNYRGINYTIAVDDNPNSQPKAFIGYNEVKVNYTQNDLTALENALKVKIDEIADQKSLEKE